MWEPETLTAAVLALGGLLTAIGVSAKNLAEVRVIRAQVQNSHGTNLRDDLDRVLAGQGRHDAELARVHDTQRDIQRAMTEGLERLADADAEDRRRADAEHARIWRAVKPNPQEES